MKQEPGQGTPQRSSHPAGLFSPAPLWSHACAGVSACPLHPPALTHTEVSSCPPHTLHPCLQAAGSKPPGTQPCSLTSWKNRISKHRNQQSWRAVGLALPGVHHTLGSGLRPGSVLPLPSHRENPHQCPPIPRALGQACSIFTGIPSILRFPKSH